MIHHIEALSRTSSSTFHIFRCLQPSYLFALLVLFIQHTLRSSKQVNKPLELASGHHSDGIPQLLSRITAARSKAEATRAAIRQHWGLADSDAASLDLGVGFTNRKGKAERGADSSHGPARKVLVGKLLRAVVTNDRAFTVAFAGTSVTAGHDNW